MDLGYDKDYNNSQYNGNIAGTKWMTAGDKMERRYEFSYDAANRLMFADFKQNFGSRSSPVWANTDPANSSYTIDFTIKMGNGIDPLSAYDANGNIKRMQQWGLKIKASPQIDDIAYNYYDNSNRLKNVIDNYNDEQTELGDFKTSANHPNKTNLTNSRIDYDYDANGNLTKDLNKDIGDNTIEGIEYNHLNLPFKVTVKNKGTITYIYDADGVKLEKVIEEPASSVNNNIAQKVSINYVNSFVYENNVLKFFDHEEGRIRQKVQQNGDKLYVYDYFIKDHLGNIRMVLTEEEQTDAYPVASLESASLNAEKTFYNIPDDPLVRVNKSSVPGYPTCKYPFFQTVLIRVFSVCNKFLCHSSGVRLFSAS